MMSSGYNINDLVQEAQTRWLKPAEVLFILQTHEESQITHEPPQKPASGSLFLFNKRVLRFFRKDGHSWRRKKDGRTVGEAHERLKVGNVEALNCYYAHGEQNPNFQRRSYWMLDQGHDHMVLVHYRDISIGRHNAGSLSVLSSGSSNLIQSPCSNTTQLPATTAVVSEPVESYESTFSPSSIEVSSDVVIKGNGTSCFDGTEFTVKTDGSPELEINQALKRLEEQLSLNDENLKDIGPFYIENDNSYDLDYDLREQSYRTTEMQDGSNNRGLQQYAGDNKDVHQYHQQLEDEFTTVRNEALNWNEILNYGGTSQSVAPHEKFSYTSDENGVALPPSRLQSVDEQVKYHSQNIEANTVYYYPTLYDQGQIEIPLEADSSLTIAREQKFTICEVSPEWGYASEATKVIIIGSFHCDPSSSTWACMFGDIEVPVEILQEGVLRCRAPPRSPGKSTLCITSGNRESCSEVREFEYRVQPSAPFHSNLSEAGAGRTSDELLLLVRFVQTLLSGQLSQNVESTEPGIDFLRNFKAGEDSWSQVIEALLFGSLTSFSTTDWLLEELLKDKLQQWLSSQSHDEKDPQHCSSKRDQGLIHMVSGLGFVWALTPILNSGVSVNFRDINGWTALHWAARFGREKMVAELLASGASAGAVTDPNAQDPTGKTPASIAATFGHKGLAGYLSEVALTTHLSTLTLEESELSRSSAEVEAERTVNTISNTNFVINEDQLSLKDTLAAVRNATQAAARIQSAFRAHSFRRRQQKEAVAYASGDEFDILGGDIPGFSAASKLAFRSTRDHNAALSIQKKYRGWKGRKDFLAFRQKVVKIQAHVRGHQVRKNYKVICWATGILEKVVLRWRRKGVGLRGFRQELETIEDSEDEDIEDVVKVFRKQKVDVAIDEAVSRVLSMVESQEARQQYRRMLERFRQAKAERLALESEAASTSLSQNTDVENDGTYTLPSGDPSQYLWIDA